MLERCSGETLADGSRVELGPEAREAVLDAAADLAASGMRVLAFAGRSLASAPPDVGAAVQDLDLIGLVALRDPLRPEASRTVSLAASAGVRIVMVTGDHPHTARAIAEAAGVAGRGAAILTGDDLRGAGIPEDLLAAPVYARVSPDQKLALVEAARAGGHVVAVTGDGVNDAPALRRADIGVAMGRSGSDVARQAADMVVTDDNLATIVDAVREGRGIYDNVRSVVDYLVAGNLSEIAVVVTCLLLFPALGVPLLPIQLLWVNLLTDGLPALALGVDPVDDRLMERPPRPRGERLVSWRRLRLLLARAAPIAASAVASLAVARFVWDEPWPHARATMFTVLVVAHLLYAFAARRRGVALLGNRALLLAVGGGIALQLLVVALPAAHGLFGTATLTLREWALVAAGGVLPLPILWMMRR